MLGDRVRLVLLVPLVTAMLLAGVDAAPALTRAEIVYRAERWVGLRVAYSQMHSFESYRQDCSGMASMAWRLDRSYSTRSLAPFGERVHRDELQPGDMVLKYDYHAAVFRGWANAEHTWYWALEQSGSVGHAVERLTKYPYWNHAEVYAYRPRHVTEIDDYSGHIREISGTDRYGTALAASRHAFGSGEATSAVLCSGADWPDALGGSALAGALGGPVLLVGPDFVPAGLADELRRLGVTDVRIVGGEGAVSGSVAAAVEALPGVNVSRIGGRDRYETAALVASATVEASVEGTETPRCDAVYVATGEGFADALGAAAPAAHTHRPILLTRHDTLPAHTERALRSLEPSSAYIAGGHGAVETTVGAMIHEIADIRIDRFAGADRYETARLLAMHAEEEGLGIEGAAIASGSDFPDALAGGVMQARLGSVLLLTPSDRLVPAADWAIRDRLEDGERATVLGGEGALGPRVRRQIRWILDPL